MKPGQIVRVDFRSTIPGTNEASKLRPAVVVGAPPVFGAGLTFELVVPLARGEAFAFAGASVAIPPAPENGANALSFAMSWNVQAVPHARIRATESRVSDAQLAEIRNQIAACVGYVD